MELIDLIKHYRDQLETNPNDYACLIFALQLPSICSRVEFPQTPENTGEFEDGKLYKGNGRTWDSNMYKKWLSEHKDSFIEIYHNSRLEDFCDTLYELRCKLTHEGILMDDESKFYFTSKERMMSFGNITFLPIKILCEGMFEAAEKSLACVNKSLKVSSFANLTISDEVYCKIYDDVHKTYQSFWNNYSSKDNLLYCIYREMLVGNYEKENEINEFFEENPDGIFREWDFDLKYGLIVDTTEELFREIYNEEKSEISRNLGLNSTVLCLAKTDYERMLQICRDLEEFSNEHQFDITKYYKA